ncbi:hypothetical protein G5C66_07755 [Nocardioides sp. KC13]|uniref:Uncharacterized protein n=1 Tax=Nocardioides turkmenicus TaxID=2711220 RepID=A0A6M1QS03_9ACTN|nr:hypothetical protein [Nocardioides sp. KC13]NGN92633.1 hypothetical protein [Nocardioides sp. KC13]
MTKPSEMASLDMQFAGIRNVAQGSVQGYPPEAVKAARAALVYLSKKYDEIVEARW